MIELLLVLALTLVGTVERLITGRRWSEERSHLIAIATARGVSAASAASLARSGDPAAAPADERVSLIPVDL